MQDTMVVSDAAQLGAAIRAIRVAAGLAQADAAALCGVSAPFMSGLERGKPTAQLGLALVVCAGLGIRIRLEFPEAIPPLDEAPTRKPRARRER